MDITPFETLSPEQRATLARETLELFRSELEAHSQGNRPESTLIRRFREAFPETE
jgi:predicted oxidoreductase